MCKGRCFYCDKKFVFDDKIIHHPIRSLKILKKEMKCASMILEPYGYRRGKVELFPMHNQRQ